MRIKNFNEFDLVKENILEDEENENNWEVRIDNEFDSYWQYKYDAIDQIVEILDTNGDEAGLEGYEDEDHYEMSKSEITEMLTDLNEEDFYDRLQDLKDFVGYEKDIKLINISDEDEIEFLEED